MKTLIQGRLANGADVKINFSQACGEPESWQALINKGSYRLSALGCRSAAELMQQTCDLLIKIPPELDVEFSAQDIAVLRHLCLTADQAKTFGLPVPDNDNYVP